jgi:hypothetical protein
LRRLLFALVCAACSHGQKPVTLPPPQQGAQQQSAGSLAFSPNVADVLAWLPDETISVSVARGPFVLAKVEDAEDTTERVHPGEVELRFQALALGLFNLPNGGVLAPLLGQRVTAVVTGVMKFRAPKSLGAGPFDGCTIIVFAEPVHGTGGDFTSSQESDVWTTHVAFPNNQVVLVCTDKAFMSTVTQRMQAHTQKRTFGVSSDAWDHVDTTARYWGLRTNEIHATYDVKERLHLASSAPDAQAVIDKLGHEVSDLDMHDTQRGAWTEATVSLATRRESLYMSMFYVMNIMGHVIFL